MCDLITGIQETHTYEYHLVVSLPPRGLHASIDEILGDLYLVCPEWREQSRLEITDYDQEDRQRIKDVLERYAIKYHVERYLKHHEDEGDS